MYHIDSKLDKPDINYLETEVRKMMARGISVGDLNQLYSKFEAERDGIANEIRESYGIQNPNSPKQLISFIEGMDSAEVYEACCIEGKWTTNKDSLQTLSLLGYPFATDILDFRKAKKYAESIKSMRDAVGQDGRVHPTVSLAKTNRINYSSPALMNIPKPLLWHIIKPNKAGNTLISADIKNQEPSILINILGAEHLKSALIDENGLYEHLFTKPFKPTAKLNILVTPSHKEGYISNTELADMGFVPPIYYTPSLPAVSTSYYNNVKVRVIDITNVVARGDGTEPELPDTVTIETVDNKQYKLKVNWSNYDKKKLKNQGIIETTGEVEGIEVRCEGIARKEFKTSWNAMTYGASSFGIKAMCKHIDGNAIYNYFSKIAEFKTYRSNCKKIADMGQQQINTYFGTVLYAGEPNPNRLRRILMDLPIQGTATDILSLLIKHINLEINRIGLKGKLSIYYTRHDEIIFEVDGDWLREVGIDVVTETIRNMVEHRVDDWTPFKVEIEQVKADRLYIDESDDLFE